MVNLRKLSLWLWLVAYCFTSANILGEEEHHTLDELFDRCRIEAMNLDTLIGNDCEAELDAYFADQSIWEYLKLQYYVPGHYEHPPIGTTFNARTDDLRVSETTHPILREIPKWRIIFDQKIEMRNHLVSQVFQDEVCKNLISGSIHPELNIRCSGDELFKYATYLEMCLTGFYRHVWLIQREAIRGGKSFFEYGLEAVATFPEKERELRSNTFKKGILNTMWLVHKCAHMPVNTFDSSLKIQTPWGRLGIQQRTSLLRSSHEAALKIAARTGHKWALFSYLPPLVPSDADYWNSLLGIEPYLVHYWIAKGRTYLSEEQELKHAVRAYTLKYGEFHKSTFDRYIREFLFRSDWWDTPSSNPIVQSIIKAPSEEHNLKGDLLVDEKLEYPW